ncbi:MAG: helix-turn-helix domain-containing protein [Lachnospiraceae bacterium]|nr:helix-turn-helix domain-containing protein [Lachnospiraceae bacterium]
MFSKEWFVQRIREVRKQHNETQKALDDCIGMKANKMENGIKTTTSEKIVRICRHHHVSAAYLLGLSDDPQGGCNRWVEEDK